MRVGEYTVGESDVWEREKEKTGRYLTRANTFVGRDGEKPSGLYICRNQGPMAAHDWVAMA